MAYSMAPEFPWIRGVLPDKESTYVRLRDSITSFKLNYHVVFR